MEKKTKKRYGKTVIVLLIIIVALIILMPYVLEFTDTTSEYNEEVTVEIPKGSSGEEIGRILKEKGLIKSAGIFRLRAKLSDDGDKMNYGTFTLYKGMCIPDIIKALAGNFTYRETVRLTVPEGFSVEQIAIRCEELGLCSKDEFLNALSDTYDYSFLNFEAGEGAKYKLQGFLYPETYEFFTDARPHDIIDKMLSQFEKEIKDINVPGGTSLYDYVTIASLLEREALLETELATIAGVINNRMEKGMKLQIDASVQYAVTGGEYNINRVTYQDLEIESPYNTYKVANLPAGPICNPSLKAIKAAVNPEKHEYLYYHTDTQKNDGSHIFTKTFDEHKETMN